MYADDRVLEVEVSHYDFANNVFFHIRFLGLSRVPSCLAFVFVSRWACTPLPGLSRVLSFVASPGKTSFNMAHGDSLQRCTPLCTELFRQVQHGPWRFPSAMYTAVHGVVQTGMYVDFRLC
ncbi:uncharacterized protein LOC144818260 [Lissotriton helveticus]